MPIGACDGCCRYYVVDAKLLVEPGCPRCGRPLRSSDTSELMSHLRDPAGHTAPPAPEDPRRTTFEFEQRMADHLMQRARAIRTQIQCQRAEVSAQVVEARRLAHQMEQLLQDLRTALHPAGIAHPH